MSIRFSLSSAALLLFVLAAPVFAVVHIADAYADTAPSTDVENVAVMQGYSLPEVVVFADAYDPIEEARMAARPAGRTTRPA